MWQCTSPTEIYIILQTGLSYRTQQGRKSMLCVINRHVSNNKMPVFVLYVGNSGREVSFNMLFIWRILVYVNYTNLIRNKQLKAGKG
jgi:hypothetical protein